MIRRFNYTDQRRIDRQHVDVSIQRGTARSLMFNARIDLREYRLPAEAHVYVEAHRQTAWMRFPFGTVGAIAAPAEAERELAEFGGDADGIKFRVKVVEPATGGDDGEPARILAQADNVEPRLPDDPDKQESLLHIISADLRGRELWRVLFGGGDAPALALDRSLVPEAERDIVARSDEFVSVAMPAAFRQILERIVLVEKYTDTEDGENWRSLWLRFAFELPGIGRAPPGESEAESPEDWIDECVEAFGQTCGVGERYAKWKGAP